MKHEEVRREKSKEVTRWKKRLTGWTFEAAYGRSVGVAELLEMLSIEENKELISYSNKKIGKTIIEYLS